MAIQINKTSAVVSGAQTLSLGTCFTITPGATNPAYLVLNALDRNEYTAAATHATGSFSGNGNSQSFGTTDGDGRSCGIVFTYNASTGQYINASLGNLAQLTFTSSASLYDITNISLFGETSLNDAQNYASSAYGLMQTDAAGYRGSLTIATDPTFAGVPPTQATPGQICAVAQSFVGAAWNDNGCWVLASTIAAEAGASLPVNSTAIGVPGAANGEWIVAYNGPAGASGDWLSKITAGDIVAFQTASGGGHITTCVSGSGATAQLIDNIAYSNGSGGFSNSAHDGSAADILVAPAHAASQEFAGVFGRNVVIYQLDTPIMVAKAAAVSLDTGRTLALSTVFSASDPASKAITQYQVYDSAAAGASFLVGTVSHTAQSAAGAFSVTSLTTLSYMAGSNAGSDTLDIRAYNGTYWGDWQAVSVTVNAFVPKAPVLGAKTADQIWKQGVAVTLALPATLFSDPQHSALTFAATGVNGAALPAWLHFNPVTRGFSGTVPAGMANFAVSVTATDTAGLSASESFNVTVPAAAPIVAVHAAAQTWIEGHAVNFVLPIGNFVDPQGQHMSFLASQSNGAALPSWLHFSADQQSFTGTAPMLAQTLQLKIIATDTAGLSVSEIIQASIKAAVVGVSGFADWHGATPAVDTTVTAPHGGGWFSGELVHPSIIAALPVHQMF